MATPRGFEPLISTVTGWHVSPLHHGAILAKVYQGDFIVSSWLINNLLIKGIVCVLYRML